MAMFPVSEKTMKRGSLVQRIMNGRGDILTEQVMLLELVIRLFCIS